MKIPEIFFLLIVIGIVYFLMAGNDAAMADMQEQDRGKSLYDRYCMVCHGEKGDGKGSAARFLFPKPRDLTLGLYRVRSTSTGEPPADADIIGTLTNGMPGSAMPAFSELSEEEKTAIMEYIKELGEIYDEPFSIIKPGKPPEVTPQLLAKGKEIYGQMKCGECHGESGKGDGPKADDLVDDWKQPAPPNSFTRGIYKGGGSPSDIYMRFTAGMDGSPMPSYEDSLDDEMRWAVVFYSLSLAGPNVAVQPTSGKIVAKWIEDVPGNPESALWENTTAFKIPLMLLWQKPDSPERLLNIKALYNEKDIAFLVEWNDATKNTLLDIDTFRDGVSLQFPAQRGAKPDFWMGHGEGKKSEGMVNIWFWKADTQEVIDKGQQPIPESPVENLIAGGFGTLAFKKDTMQVFGMGKWKGRKWSVVFKRPFNGPKGNAEFIRGELTPVSFAVWDGGENDVDGRKAVSTWYYVVPED